MRVFRAIALAATGVIAVAGPVVAQTRLSNVQPPPDGVEIRAGYEIHRDHLRYTFENRSNIDTDFLVPHSFTQRYVANNHWIAGSARYTVRGDVMQTEAAFTPERQGPGSDLDTFYDPNGDVVISGTNGDVKLHSLRFAQWSEGRLFGMPWRVGYSFRRDRTHFLPTDRIITHTNPPSEAHSPTLGHETTISQVHEIPIEVSWPWKGASRWDVVPRLDVSPLVFARLITKLPDKYPGQNIIFDAKSIGVGGGLDIARRRSWPIVISLHYGQTWGYQRAQEYRRSSLMAAIGFGLKR